jgi:aerotaxis receptor
MKNNQPITQREQALQSDDRLISTTDLKGIITDCNEAFARVSGFSREELLGRPHNIVRHPDMPTDAYKDLWSALKGGRSWLGLVKNRCKNGDHYYVEAHVTPIFDDGRIIGYQSVRSGPERTAVNRADKLYARLLAGKGAGSSLRDYSLQTKGMLAALLIAVPAIAAALVGKGSWLAAIATLLLAGGGIWLLLRPVIALAGRTREQFDDALAQQVFAGRGDEVGQLDVALRALAAEARTILGRVEHAAGSLGEVAGATSGIVEQTTEGVRRQQLEVDQVATAMNEMAATVVEVARLAEETARASQNVLTQTEAGSRQVSGAIADIEALSQAVEDATAVIERLQAESQSIGSVVDVISNIASETNLLALNAAIEAARAGDQGRGFAVVADEVRNLASHTQKSTDEIQQMIKSIQSSSEAAVKVMQAGQVRAEGSVDLSRQVGQSFEEISVAIDRITQMNAQVATASEEQTAVTEEINRNLVGISGVASETLASADQTAEASQRLYSLVNKLQSMLRQFGRH